MYQKVCKWRICITNENNVKTYYSNVITLVFHTTLDEFICHVYKIGTVKRGDQSNVHHGAPVPDFV